MSTSTLTNRVTEIRQPKLPAPNSDIYKFVETQPAEDRARTGIRLSGKLWSEHLIRAKPKSSFANHQRLRIAAQGLRGFGPRNEQNRFSESVKAATQATIIGDY